MRVLYLLNVSNSSQLSADSGYTFANMLAPALTDAGAEVTVASPVPVGDSRVHFALTTSPSTKYRARFDPGMDALVNLIRDRRPEVVVANQIEAAPAIRAALLEAGVDALIAGYCHYLPFSFTDDGVLELDPALNDLGLGRSVLLAFAAGLGACDRVLVHSSTAASWTTAAAARAGVDLGDKLYIVPAPRDVRLVCDPAGITPPEGMATGFYNHRLYKHYGTARFTQLARRPGAAHGDGPVRHPQPRAHPPRPQPRTAPGGARDHRRRRRRLGPWRPRPLPQPAGRRPLRHRPLPPWLPLVHVGDRLPGDGPARDRPAHRLAG
ncbi:hypothetical protein [Streptomyces sp. Iso 434]|uniref:hypothetical protein n=1 Tax=Streptomyces sp. Iso 434 TaxID=3062272 RepID=UPI00397F263A